MSEMVPYGWKEIEIEQLVLPKQLQRTVLELAHEIAQSFVLSISRWTGSFGSCF